MAIVGWIAAAITRVLFAPHGVEPLVAEIPVWANSCRRCELSIIGAFQLLCHRAIGSLFIPLFSSLVQRSVLGGLDRGWVPLWWWPAHPAGLHRVLVLQHRDHRPVP